MARQAKLTHENFSIAEMTECNFAQRLSIDNTPDLATLENLGRTVTGLEQVRALLGYPVHVNSGYRCDISLNLRTCQISQGVGGDLNLSHGFHTSYIFCAGVWQKEPS